MTKSTATQATLRMQPLRAHPGEGSGAWAARNGGIAARRRRLAASRWRLLLPSTAAARRSFLD